MDTLNFPIEPSYFVGFDVFQIVLYALVVVLGFALKQLNVFANLKIQTSWGILFLAVTVGGIFVATKTLTLGQAFVAYTSATATYELVWRWLLDRFFKV